METNFNTGYTNYQPRNNYGNNAYGDRTGYQPNSFNYPPNRDQYRNNNYNPSHGNHPNRYNSPGSSYGGYNNGPTSSNYPSRKIFLIQTTNHTEISAQMQIIQQQILIRTQTWGTTLE
jgi:hypothetical protein